MNEYHERPTVKPPKIKENTEIDSKKAIEVIKSNYPDSRYTMLRKALDLSIRLLEEDAKKEQWYKNQ